MDSSRRRQQPDGLLSGGRQTDPSRLSAVIETTGEVAAAAAVKSSTAVYKRGIIIVCPLLLADQP